MKNFKTNALQPKNRGPMALRWSALCSGAVVSALLLPGCSVEVQNIQPAQELKHQAQPAGSVYTGWRVFQDKCASCHGPAATGTPGGPDLLPRVREMGSRQFVGLVLKRYDWNLGAAQPGKDSPAWDALVDDIVFTIALTAIQAEQQAQKQAVDRLRSLKPTGRIMLGLQSAAAKPEALPTLRLENQDSLVVPAEPDFVYVLGSVNTESSLIWKAGNTVQDYLAVAGITSGADKDE